MNALAWVLLVWGVLAILGGLFALWFGWHLRRYRGQHARPHVHTRALWLVEREHLDCSEPSGRDPPE